MFNGSIVQDVAGYGGNLKGGGEVNQKQSIVKDKTTSALLKCIYYLKPKPCITL